MKAIISILGLIFTLNVLAISELNYTTNFNKFVLPLMHSMKDGEMKSNGLNIHFKTLLNPTATNCLVILPGRSEPAEKYAELVFDLEQSAIGSHLNYFIMDHRGQGSSDRMTSKNDMGYVDHFSNYVSDLGNFIETVVNKSNCQKKFLFAHSMGAGIGLSYIANNPKTFDALAISSPMLKIQTKPYSYLVAKSIVTSMMAIGRGDEFAIGQKGYNPNDNFEENRFTTSKDRFAMTMNIYKDFPKTQLGGVSNKWIFEVMNGTSKIRKNYSKITAPMKVFRAGNELYSESSEMSKLCSEALQCDEYLFENSKHEVYNDRDETRDAVIANIVELFSKI